MTLQAFIDDSGSEPQSSVFVLAGHISSPKRWNDFSDEWTAALAKPPGAAYFKASEAMSLRGEFSRRKGWDDELRNERVIELSEIIWKFASVAISAQIIQRDWEDTFRKLTPVFARYETKRFSHPYAFLWFNMLSHLWLHPTKLALTKGPCDFIFDRQLGHEAEVLSLWRDMRNIMHAPPLLPENMRNWIGAPPTFHDDKTQLPLQAADLWAWSNRRAIAFEPHELKLPQAAIERLCAVPAMHLNISRDYLISELWKLIEQIKRLFPERTS